MKWVARLPRRAASLRSLGRLGEPGVRGAPGDDHEHAVVILVVIEPDADYAPGGAVREDIAQHVVELSAAHPVLDDADELADVDAGRYLEERFAEDALLRVAGGALFVIVVTIDPELREELTHSYKEDILKLQDLIGRDLSTWLR